MQGFGKIMPGAYFESLARWELPEKGSVVEDASRIGNGDGPGSAMSVGKCFATRSHLQLQRLLERFYRR